MANWSQIRWFLSGLLLGVLLLFGLVAWQYSLFLHWPTPRDANAVGPVAISPRWSITLEQKPSNPYLAEYDYRLRVFRSERREGDYAGAVDLIPNAGGRTYLCLYSLTAADREPLLEVVDRAETSLVDLQSQRRLSTPPKGYERRFVGAFVEEAAPLRFVPAEVLPTCPSDR